MEKTNAIRLFDRKKLSYSVHSYDNAISGIVVATTLGQEAERVFKTLVTVGKSGANFVFMIPVAEELDLKKAAKTVEEKSISMLPQRELLPLTGYVHGGCSPLGMKKQFRTVLHESALQYKTIFFSGGKIGLQIETDPKNLEKMIGIEYGNVIENG